MTGSASALLRRCDWKRRQNGRTAGLRPAGLCTAREPEKYPVTLAGLRLAAGRRPAVRLRFQSPWSAHPFFQGPNIGSCASAMAICREKAAAKFPKQRPDFLPVCLRDLEPLQLCPAEKAKFSFGMICWQRFEPYFDFKQEHEPVGLSFVAALGNKPGQMQVLVSNRKAKLLGGFAAGPGVGRFALFNMNFATARAPKAAVWWAVSLE